jgi:hypothetical protein
VWNWAFLYPNIVYVNDNKHKCSVYGELREESDLYRIKFTKEFYDNRNTVPQLNGPFRNAHASPFWSHLHNP